MKWIFRLFYLVIVSFISLIVFDYASMKKNATYYNENAVQYLNDNQMEEYIPHFMTANGVKEYLRNPLYHIQTESNMPTLDFSIYHAKTDKTAYLVFFIHNLKLDVTSTNVKLEMKLYMKGDQVPLESYFDLDNNRRMPVILLESKEGVNDLLYYEKTVDKKAVSATSTEIEKIEFSLYDFSKTQDKQALGLPKWLITSVNDFNTEDNFKLKNEIYQSEKFNGKAENYTKNNLYQEEINLGKLYVDKLEQYNGVYISIVTIYIVILVLITYLIFLLKPTIKLIQEKKLKKELEADEVGE